MLQFVNLAEKYGFTASVSTHYEVTCSMFDNLRERPFEKGLKVTEQKPVIQVPWRGIPAASRNIPLLAGIRSLYNQFPHWSDPVTVYFRSNSCGYEVVGIERQSSARAIGREGSRKNCVSSMPEGGVFWLSKRSALGL